MFFEQRPDSLNVLEDTNSSSLSPQEVAPIALTDTVERIDSVMTPVVEQESVKAEAIYSVKHATFKTEHVKIDLPDTNTDYDSVNVDSVIYSELLTDTSLTPTPLFETHELITDRIQSNTVTAKAPDWLLGLLLVTFLLIAWARVYHKRRLRQLYQALTSKLYVQHVLRMHDGLMKRVSFVLNLVSYLMLASFLFQVSQYYELNIPYSIYLHPFLLILFSLVVLYQIKNVILIMSGVLLDQQEKLDEYRFNVFLMNKMLGLVLTPIIICIAYLSFGESVNITIGIFLIILSYLYRINRGVSIGLKEANVSVFYLFMYLCTLEILPLVVLTRLFIDIN